MELPVGVISAAAIARSPEVDVVCGEAVADDYKEGGV
jgi:hypothetical protein